MARKQLQPPQLDPQLDPDPCTLCARAARAKLVRIFLVTRRSGGGGGGVLAGAGASERSILLHLSGESARSSERSQLIELSSLANGQSVHLNLAPPTPPSSLAKSTSKLSEREISSSHHLQLVCVLVGAMPPATIRWTARNRSAARLDDEALVSDDPIETERIVELATGSRGRRPLDGDDNDDEDDGRSRRRSEPGPILRQWSSVKVHNIGVAHHLSSIECEGVQQRSIGASAPDRIYQASASIRLNVTHLPQVSLSAASQQRTDMVFAAYETDTVELVCRVSFANPKLLEPIKWLVSEQSEDDDKAPPTRSIEDGVENGYNLIKIVNRTSDQSNEFEQNERLRLRVIRPPPPPIKRTGNEADNDNNNSSSQNNSVTAQTQTTTTTRSLRFRFACQARNALGIGKSNPIQLVAGAAPKCLSAADTIEMANGTAQTTTATSTKVNNRKSDSNISDNRDYKSNPLTAATTREISAQSYDKKYGKSVHCPVEWVAEIDGADFGAQVFWRVNQSHRRGRAIKLAQVKGADEDDTESVIAISNGPNISLEHLLERSLRNNIDLDNGSANDKSKPKDISNIICYAANRFGSNEQSPCKVSVHFGAALATAPSTATPLGKCI